MKTTALFKKKEIRSGTKPEAEAPGFLTLDSALLSLLRSDGRMTPAIARSIPALYAGIKLLTGIVSTLPIYLYSEKTGKTRAISDERVALLNDDTGDLLDGTQFKAAMVEDYLLSGRAYAFVRRSGLRVIGIHYVDPAFVGINRNSDPIFKTATLNIQGRMYEPESFIRLLNCSRDGVSGSGIVDTCNDLLDVARETLKYERSLVHSGGAKKGFLKSKNRLTDPALDSVKEAWARLWNGGSSAMVLNDGMDFMEASATSVEMQLSERKRNNDEAISKLLNIPPSVLDGTANEATFRQLIQLAVVPILSAIESACNRALLLESEKNRLYFAFDSKELFKGDALTRFRAYELALRNGFMQIDEVRFREDLPPIGFKFLRLGLQDVYYNPDTGEVYTPNTDKSAKLASMSPGGAPDEPKENGRSLTSDNGQSIIERRWDEGQHPRDEDGKFTFGSGGGKASAREELDSRIADGRISTKIDSSAQNRHIEGAQKYKNAVANGKYPSTLSLPKNEWQPLVDRYIKEGKPIKKNDGSIRVDFTHSKTIGTAWSKDGKDHAPTRRGQLHLSKNGVHIVPMFERGKQK